MGRVLPAYVEEPVVEQEPDDGQYPYPTEG